VTVQTGMAPGTYCDIIDGAKQGNTCSGSSVTVDHHGFATITVGSYDSVAFTAADRI
jgi:alpha-amylase